MKQQKGFTLIELIVVIVILGILAATALPKFSGISADARAAKMNAIASAMKDASMMAHGQYLAEQIASNATVKLADNSTTIKLINGFPDATAVGIGAGLGADITAPDPTLTITPAGADASGGAVYLVKYTNYPNCAVTYTSTTGALLADPVVDTASVIPSQAATNCN